MVYNTLIGVKGKVQGTMEGDAELVSASGRVKRNQRAFLRVDPHTQNQQQTREVFSSLTLG